MYPLPSASVPLDRELTGASDSQGVKGTDGDPGKHGPNGDDGARGPQGPRGRRGREGKRGPEGPLGKNGPNGPPGANGPQGDRGRAAYVGTPGLQGKKGPPGAPGRDGDPGTPGSRGATGIRGLPGSPGKRGPPGTDGKGGKSVCSSGNMAGQRMCCGSVKAADFVKQSAYAAAAKIDMSSCQFEEAPVIFTSMNVQREGRRYLNSASNIINAKPNELDPTEATVMVRSEFSLDEHPDWLGTWTLQWCAYGGFLTQPPLPRAWLPRSRIGPEIFLYSLIWPHGNSGHHRRIAGLSHRITDINPATARIGIQLEAQPGFDAGFPHLVRSSAGLAVGGCVERLASVFSHEPKSCDASRARAGIVRPCPVEPTFDVSNAKCYADRYPDLKAAFGYNVANLIEHFKVHGQNEGRVFNCLCSAGARPLVYAFVCLCCRLQCRMAPACVAF